MYMSCVTDTDTDGGFIGPVPEIKVQSLNNRME